MIQEVLAAFFGRLFIMLAIGLIAVFCWVIYGTYKITNKNNEDIIESKVRLIPKIKLHTDGTTIDTIYIYQKSK